MAPTHIISDATWQSFEKRLRTYVRSRVDPQWVDDVVGRILVRLVQNKSALEAAENPIAYVQTVSTNMVTDHYRRRAVELRALAEIYSESMIRDHVADRESGEAEQVIAGCMMPFIENLPSPYRETLALTEIERLSQKDAAKRLGLSVPGLKSRVQRGRRLLKQAVTDCCNVELDQRGRVMDYERRSGNCSMGC